MSSSTKSNLDTSDEVVFKGYEELINKRNVFFKYMGAMVVVGGLLLSIPRWQLSRRTRSLYKRHCRGHVLDLSPKLLDGSSVALYESSPCLKVNFLVNTVVNTDAEYKDLVDELSEDDPKRKQLAKDMTIKFLESNDHTWVNSEVTFEVIPRSNPATFDTVVLHSELWQHPTAEAQALLTEGNNRLRDRVLIHPKVATKKSKGKVKVAPTQPEAKESNQTGRIILVDLAVPKSWTRTIKLLKWVHEQTEGNIYFTHDLPPMFEAAGLEVVEHHPFFGVYHFYALQKKTPTAIPEPAASDEGEVKNN
jgi:hypothetical protein